MISKIALLSAFLIFVSIEAKPCGFCGGHGFRKPPPCGPPPFLEDLPADAQEKINNIWKNYKEGDKCYEEQGLTREVIEALPKEAKRNLHKKMPLPPFLRGLPKETLAKFEVIFNDKSIPWAEKPKKIDALAEKELTGDALKKFQEFKEKKEQEEKEYKDKERQLTPEALAAYEKIEALQKQKWAIMGELSDEVMEELFDLWKSRPHFRHH